MNIFSTNRQESVKTKVIKIGFNFFPAYRRSGGRVIFISSDWHEVHIKLSLNWTTRNYVGSVFGGSIYAAVDPVYMLQLIKILGKNYVIWDKAATINFIKPIKATVYAKFELNQAIIDNIISQVKQNNKYLLELPVQFVDDKGIIYAEINKTLYIADKNYYQNKPRS